MANGIGVVDSGAVPDASTKIKGGDIALTRIVKISPGIRHGSTVIALIKIDANDNFAPVAMAA